MSHRETKIITMRYLHPEPAKKEESEELTSATELRHLSHNIQANWPK